MFDFSISQNGELIMDSTQPGIKKVDKDDLRKQIAINRIKSVTGDWFNANIGSNVEEFLGMPCTQETVNNLIDAIKIDLTDDKFFDRSELFFIPKIEKNSISLLIFLKGIYQENPKIINVAIDIVSGVKVQYDPYTQ